MIGPLLQRLAATHRSLPSIYWTVWLGTLINRLGAFVIPLLTFYLTRDQHLSLPAAGAIVSLFGVGQVGAALVGGVLADRLGRRATILLSMGGGAVAMTALGLVTAPASIAVIVLILGFVGDLYRPAVAALVADVVPPGDRLRAYALLYWVINLGFAIAPVLGGVLAGFSYTMLFIGDAVTMAVYGVIVALRVPETRPVAPPVDAAAPPRRPIGLLDVLADRPFLTFTALNLAVALIAFQTTVALSAFMGAQGHSEWEFGAVLAANGLLIIVGQPFLIRVGAARDPSRLLALSALLFGAGLFLHGQVALLPLHVAAVAVWTIGEIVASPINSMTVAQMAPAEARGRYQGVFALSWGLASAGGPLLGSRIMASAGPAALWAGCLGLGAAAAIGFLVTAPSRARRLAAATASVDRGADTPPDRDDPATAASRAAS